MARPVSRFDQTESASPVIRNALYVGNYPGERAVPTASSNPWTPALLARARAATLATRAAIEIATEGMRRAEREGRRLSPNIAFVGRQRKLNLARTVEFPDMPMV